MRPILYILLILIVAGCKKSDSATTDVEQTAVSFETNYDWTVDGSLTTRGEAKSGFERYDEIGILAYYIQNGESIVNLTPNFMYNQCATFDQSGESFAWLYSPVKYWPNNTTDSLQFFAYYPYFETSAFSNDDQDTGVQFELTSSSDMDYPEVSFRQADYLGQQVDFMTAQTVPLSKCDEVPFVFEHQLTQVSFAARHNGVSTDEIYVTKLVLKIEDAKVALTGYFTDTGFVATTDGATDDKEYVLTTEEGFLFEGYGYRLPEVTDEVFFKTVNTTEGTLMLPAQDISAGSVTIEVTVSIFRGWNEDDENEDTDVISGVKTLNLVVNQAHEYPAGEAILYQFTLDLETSQVDMALESIVREKWVDAETDIGGENINDEVGSIW